MDPYIEQPCQVTYCDNVVRVPRGWEGLALCEPCRDAIWGDTDPYYEE